MEILPEEEIQPTKFIVQTLEKSKQILFAFKARLFKTAGGFKK